MQQREDLFITAQLFQSLLENQNFDEITSLASSMEPIDVSLAFEELEPEEVNQIIDCFTQEEIAKIIEQSSEAMQLIILQPLSNNRILSIFSYMSKDDIVDILGNFTINKRKEIIRIMKVGERKAIEELLGYKEDTAGGIMTTEYIALYSKLSVLDALSKIKEIGPRTEIIETIFVLGEEKQLVGSADLRDILVAKNETKLEEIMDTNVLSVEPELDQEQVARFVSKYDLNVIPVVNKRKSLLGIITVDDVIDVIIEEQTEDILHLGGVSKEENVDNTLGQSVRMRLPWLFINLATAFLASFTVGLFEDTIASVVALAAAMPIVAGMGGNAGTQTLSIMIRSIALGEIQIKDSWRLLWKEVSLGIINGAATGIVTGLILYMRYGNPYLGLIIFISMIGNLVIAGFFGFLIPLILKSLKFDPALASAIFLTTATDVFGFFLFLGLAQLFLPLLI